MISIITVCHRSHELLKAYASSFLTHNEDASSKGSYEFIFVENSGDERVESHANTLRERGFSAQTWMTENRGFGAGCNEGARLASGRLLVFVNPDVTFKSSLAPLEGFFNNNGWGTVMQLRGANLTYSFDLLPEYRNCATELARIYRLAHHFTFLRKLCYPIGSFFVVGRDAFLDLGGFDERFFLYFEEAELSRRLRAKLGVPAYCKEVSVLHQGFGSQSSSDFTLLQEAKGMITYAQVIGQPELALRRVLMLRRLSLVSRSAGARAHHLAELIRSEVSQANNS
jgi:GT2 family glycosyltransferase